MAVHCLPSPKQVSSKRIEQLMSSGIQTFDTYPPETQALAECSNSYCCKLQEYSRFLLSYTGFQSCSSSEDVPVVVFVSKLFPVDFNAFPQNRRQ